MSTHNEHTFLSRTLIINCFDWHDSFMRRGLQQHSDNIIYRPPTENGILLQLSQKKNLRSALN